MKKILFVIILASFAGTVATAQTQKVAKDETKVTKTSTLPQKVHNTFSKHKKHSGVKVKHVKKVEKSN